MMRRFSYLVGMVCFVFASTISATNLNGRFVVAQSDSTKISVLLQISTNTGTDDLGGATIVVGFNNSKLLFNNSPQRNIDYIFHNFSGGNYSPATVTKPIADKIWINIDLPDNNKNNGTVVSGTNGWTDLVTLSFNLASSADSAKFSWLSSNIFWAIYDANNSTMWGNGNLQNLSHKLNFDNSPPELQSAVFIDSTTVELAFSETLDNVTANNKSNYSINNNIVTSSVTLSSDKKKVNLKTSAHIHNQTYTIVVSNIKDLAGNIISANKNSAQYIAVIDNTPPDVTNLTVTNTKAITVKFSKKMDVNSAKDKGNYSISNNIVINQVQLLPDSSGVLLKTTTHAANSDYTLTVSNVKDNSGNYIYPNPRQRAYRTPVKTKGKSGKTNIHKASANSWFQNYTPEKTIDGVGMSDPDSRWSSSINMPDTIKYDLGKLSIVDSMRISFHKWENGKQYEYSVFSSVDSVNWSPVIQNIWSDNLEWTEIEFDSVEAKYLNVVLLKSNQGPNASIWEVEMFGSEDGMNNVDTELIPTSVELFQNYPNPFNPTTKIRVQLPDATQMRLVVYNTLGELVTELANGQYGSGYHEFNFDGAGLSSGIYIYRLESGDLVQTKKLILMK